jgi:hypothetical protein
MPYLGSTPNASFSTRTKQDFTANGSTTAFTLSSAVASPNDIEVFVGNVRQEPTDAYTVNGTTLTMSEAPDVGLNFYVVFKGLEENSIIPADGTISSGKIAANAVTNAKIASGISSSKLTGALPAISGAALTNLVGSLSYNGGTTLSNLRIQTGTVTTPNSSVDAGTAEGLSARYYNNTAVTLTGFASTPTVFAMAITNYHETVCSPIPASPAPSASSVTLRTRSARTAGIQSISLYYIAIGQAS